MKPSQKDMSNQHRKLMHMSFAPPEAKSVFYTCLNIYSFKLSYLIIGAKGVRTRKEAKQANPNIHTDSNLSELKLSILAVRQQAMMLSI